MRMLPQILELSSMNDYSEIISAVLNMGEERSPRGLKTLDLGHTTIVMPCIGGFLPTGQGRGLNPAIGAVEAIQLIAGQAFSKLVLKVAPQFASYMNNDTFHGAYGARIGRQVDAVIRKLQTDSDTRQAVITLWDPWLDNIQGMRDYPCTTALRFSIVDGCLDLDVLMRSSDAWLGIPYDIFQFTQLQQTVAMSLNLQLGEYRHTTWSLHLYTSNIDVAERFLENTRITSRDVFRPSGIGYPGLSFQRASRRAQAIARNDLNMLNNTLGSPLTRSEQWYWKVLHDASTSKLG